MNSGIITPGVYSFKDSDPVFVYGEPLCTFGLSNHGAINGFGVVSFGLLWQLFDLWCDNDYHSTIATTWAAASGSSIATTWTSPQFGMYGPYSPIGGS